MIRQSGCLPANNSPLIYNKPVRQFLRSAPNKEKSVMFAASTRPLNQIEHQTYCDLLEASSIEESLDLGSAIVHRVSHPVEGKLILINTAQETCAMCPA
jgi:hypothetical protein